MAMAYGWFWAFVAIIFLTVVGPASASPVVRGDQRPVMFAPPQAPLELASSAQPLRRGTVSRRGTGRVAALDRQCATLFSDRSGRPSLSRPQDSILPTDRTKFASQILLLWHREKDLYHPERDHGQARTQGTNARTNEEMTAELLALEKSLSALQRQEMARHFHETLGLVWMPEDQVHGFRDRLSESNLNRIVTALGPPPEGFIYRRLWTKTERLLNANWKRFAHNSTSVVSGEKPRFWLSSQQISRLGFSGGRQEELSFNRDYLKTSNWIFFWGDGRKESEYGESGVSVSIEYAQEAGFISPFVMYPRELLLLSFIHEPDVISDLVARIAEEFPKVFQKAREEMNSRHDITANPYERFKYFMAKLVEGINRQSPGQDLFWHQYQSYLDASRSLLSRYVFTAHDYRHLAQEVIARYVYSRFLRNPFSVSYLLGRSELNETFKQAMLHFKLPYSFELKIPVAIPSENFEYIESDSSLD